MKGEWERHCLPLRLLAMKLNTLMSGTQMPHWQMLFKKWDRIRYLRKYLGALCSYHREVAVLQHAFSALVKKEEAVSGPLCFTDFIVMLYKMIKFSRFWHLSIWLVGNWTIGFGWDATLTSSCQGCLNKADCACGFALAQMNCNDGCSVGYSGMQCVVQWDAMQQLRTRHSENCWSRRGMLWWKTSFLESFLQPLNPSQG